MKKSKAGTGKSGKRALRETAAILQDAYMLGPALMSPEALVARLAEVDPRYVDLLARQMRQGVVGAGVGALQESTQMAESDRLRTVAESRRMYAADVLTEFVVSTWTNFGFGLSLEVVPRDERARPAWGAFFTSPANSYVFSQREIQKISRDVLNDGDFLFLFFITRFDGAPPVVRTVPTHEITGGPRGDGVITLPDDARVMVLYRRQLLPVGQPPTAANPYPVLYYRDWRATDEMVEAVMPRDAQGNALAAFPDGPLAERVNPATHVVALLAAHRARTIRGWPLMTTGLPWSLAYKDFLQDRAAVAKAAAMYFDKIKAKGGQRAISAIVASLQSSLAGGGDYGERNPPPAAGSTWVENEQVDRSRFTQGTGAGDAATDSAALLGQAVLAGGIYAHWAGRGESYRLATASAIELPTIKAFNLYQLFWSSIWADMAQIVLRAAQEFGSLAAGVDYAVDVNTDALLNVAIAEIQAVAEIVTAGVVAGVLSVEDAQAAMSHLMRVALQSLGIRNTQDVLPDAEDAPEDAPDAVPSDAVPAVPAVGLEPDLQALALNGTQIDSLIEIVLTYTRGELSRDSALGIIRVSFPLIPEAQIDNILSKAGAKPTPAAGTAPVQAAEVRETVRDMLLGELAAGAVVIAEAGGPDAYRLGLARAVRALWAGLVGEDDFTAMMVSAIRRGLTDAWQAGAREGGTEPEDATPEELTAEQDAIGTELDYIAGFASAIRAGSRAEGGTLAAFDGRLDQWARRWEETKTRARVMADADGRSMWRLDAEAEHCSPGPGTVSCLQLAGKVKRNSTWQAAGLYPRCERVTCGTGCKCRLEPTDAPITRGPLPRGA